MIFPNWMSRQLRTSYEFMCKGLESEASKSETLSPCIQRSYGADPLQKIHIYKSAYSTTSPLVILIPGLYFVAAHAALAKDFAINLALSGRNVVVIQTRQAPEFQYFDQLQDIAAAFQWIYLKGKQHSLDTSLIDCIAENVGAHLLLSYINSANKEYLQKAYNLKDFDLLSSFHKIIMMNGLYSFKASEIKGLVVRTMIRSCLSKNDTQAYEHLVSPLEHLSELPCTLHAIVQKSHPFYSSTLQLIEQIQQTKKSQPVDLRQLSSPLKTTQPMLWPLGLQSTPLTETADTLLLETAQMCLDQPHSNTTNVLDFTIDYQRSAG